MLSSTMLQSSNANTAWWADIGFLLARIKIFIAHLNPHHKSADITGMENLDSHGLAERLGMNNNELHAKLYRYIRQKLILHVNFDEAAVLSLLFIDEMVSFRSRMDELDARGPGKLVSVKEACRLMCISRSTLYRLLKKEALDTTVIEGRRFITRDSIDIWCVTSSKGVRSYYAGTSARK